jgi:hypothetical protein
MSKPDELYKVDPATGNAEEISFINKPLLDQIEMGGLNRGGLTQRMANR